jgi:phospholipase/carboxylesterase
MTTEVKLSPGAKKLIIFLHGVGSNSSDLMSLVPFLEDDLNDVSFISPNGIEKFDSASFETEYSRQWFSLKNSEPKIVHKLLDKNINIISDLIKTEQNKLGFANKDTILVGFSQGSMVALYLNFITNDPFLAVVAFSGIVVEPEKLLNTKTPICLIHGMSDDIIPFVVMEQASKFLLEHNIVHETYAIPNLAHSIDLSGLKFMIKFLKSLDEKKI